MTNVIVQVGIDGMNKTKKRREDKKEAGREGFGLWHSGRTAEAVLQRLTSRFVMVHEKEED